MTSEDAAAVANARGGSARQPAGTAAGVDDVFAGAHPGGIEQAREQGLAAQQRQRRHSGVEEPLAKKEPWHATRLRAAEPARQWGVGIEGLALGDEAIGADERGQDVAVNARRDHGELGIRREVGGGDVAEVERVKLVGGQHEDEVGGQHEERGRCPRRPNARGGDRAHRNRR